MRRAYFLFLLCAAALRAQNPGQIIFQGSLRLRGEAWDWFQADANHAYAYSGNQLRFGLSQQREHFYWQVELAAPFLLGMPDDAISATGAQGQLGQGASYSAANHNSRFSAMIFPKQAFVRFTRERHTLALGRFDFRDGTEMTPADATLAWVKRERAASRLIGPVAFSQSGRSLDGAHYAWGTSKTNLTLTAAMPTRGVYQTDGWGQLHAAVLYGSATREFAGADVRAFVIYYDDWRHAQKVDNRSAEARRGDLANIRVATFGGHAAGVAKTAAGRFDGLLWGAAQTGRWGLLGQRSGAVLFEGGWQPEVKAPRPWLRAGYSYTTGDRNPADGVHGTFFQVIPTSRSYARFPFFDMMNNEDIYGMLLLRPRKSVTVRSDVHGLRLTSSGDLWYSGAGASQVWAFGFTGRATNGNRGLATLYDTSVEVTASQHATFTGYFGHAVGHSAIAAVYPKGKNGNFGYLEMLLKF